MEETLKTVPIQCIGAHTLDNTLTILKRPCAHCKVEYELTAENFHRNAAFKGGLSYHCKDCRKKISKGSWQRLSQAAKDTKSYKRKNILAFRAVAIINSYKSSDRKKGIEFNITKDQAIELLKQPCIYCGDSKPAGIGLDRIDNSKGHTIDNVVPCCYECNTARSDNFSFDEMKILGSVIRLIKRTRNTT